MEKLEKLYEGKAKQLYATDDPEVLWVEYKNSATAGDGEKKEDFAGKGRLNNLITTLIFDLLKKRGIDSHLVARVGETSQLVKKVTMFPLEIVLRNTAAGHFCSRLGVEEGIELKEPVLEYFLKNDDLHDPFVNDDDLPTARCCSPTRSPRIPAVCGTSAITPARSNTSTRICSAATWATSSPPMRRSKAVWPDSPSPRASKSQSNAFASPHLKRKPDAGFLVISQSFILLSIQIQ